MKIDVVVLLKNVCVCIAEEKELVLENLAHGSMFDERAGGGRPRRENPNNTRSKEPLLELALLVLLLAQKSTWSATPISSQVVVRGNLSA